MFQLVAITGSTGGGKTTQLAEFGLDCLWENQKYLRKGGLPREVASNLRFSPKIEAIYGLAEKYPGKGLIRYWDDPAEIVKLRNVDILWDEAATAMDATQWANMSLELKRFLQQHRKYGINIFYTTQDFDQIDIAARRLTHNLIYLTKIIGSRDISANKPPVKFIWGLTMKRNIDPKKWDPEAIKGGFAGFRFTRRELVEAFDTTQEIKLGKYPPLRHVERDCELDNCPHHKIVHI